MTDLGPIFARLGLARYLDAFVDEGFETWETVLDITEGDLDALQVKRGHRRILQREIARYRGYPIHQALGSPGRTSPGEDGHVAESDDKGGGEGEHRSGTGPAGKRKYRRHPKPDENAPERPPSAYVIFSNNIAKLVGEKWQLLDPDDKASFESQAASLKEKFTADMAEYKKTESFKEYSQYLVDFKAKHSAPRDEGKRPKLETERSTASTGSSSTGAAPTVPKNPLAAHGRLDSTGSVPESTSSGYPSPSAPPPGQAPWQTLSHPQHTSPSSLSPTTASPIIRQGYRESRLGQGQSGSQVWPSVEEHRMSSADPASHPQLPRIMSMEPGDPRASVQGRPQYAAEQVPYRDAAFQRRTERPQPPAPLKHEDTSWSSSSALSGGTSASSTGPSRLPITPADDIRSLRTLPLPPQMAGGGNVSYFDPVPRQLSASVSSTLQPSLYSGHGTTKIVEPPSSSSTPGFEHKTEHAAPWNRLSEPPTKQEPSSPLLRMPKGVSAEADLKESQVKYEDEMDDEPRSTSPFSILLRAGKSIEKGDRDQHPGA